MSYALRVQPPHVPYDVTVIKLLMAFIESLVAGKHQRTRDVPSSSAAAAVVMFLLRSLFPNDLVIAIGNDACLR